MPDLGDLRLNKSADANTTIVGEPPRQGRLYALLAIVALIVVAAGAYLALRRPTARPTTTPAPQTSVKNDVVLARERGDDIALPPLDDTDPIVRELVGRLSSHPQIAAWLATKGLIRN